MRTLQRLLFTVIIYAFCIGQSGAATPQIAAGYFHNAALKNDGSVWTWGYNGFGQLGNGNTTDTSTPIQVGNLSDVKAIAAGFFHTAALKNDGTVWVWGDNGYAQLGIGPSSLAYTATPVKVLNLSGVTAIAAAGGHTLALKADGTVWAWGWNDYGQLGIGSNTNADIPTQVSQLQDISTITAGFFHSLAANHDGALWAWGYNGHGQLGNNNTTSSTQALRLTGLPAIESLAAGGGHSLALDRSGAVWAWGWNNHGQLGDGSVASSGVPHLITGLKDVTSVAAGFFHSAALDRHGKLQTWGYNEFGQLGIHSNVDTGAPIVLPNFNAIASITASNNHTLALQNDGAVWSWGWNDNAQLGNGGRNSTNVPGSVLGQDGAGLLNLGVSSYSDLWFNPAEPGWGVGITQHGNTLFASWYTYDGAGKATWLVIADGIWTDSKTYSANLYATSGQNTTIAFAPGNVLVKPVGKASFVFADADHASLEFTYEGIARTKPLSRFVFDNSHKARSVNYSDTWWMPSEPGWGLSIAQQFDTLVASWYTYDANGKPTWLVMSGGQWLSASVFKGALYQATSTPTGMALDQDVVTLTTPGSATISFTDENHAIFHYEIGGITGSKNISRLPF
ncbi:MAG: hypothetical protein V4805_14400 [Pseudomonadota bacterium]